MHQLTEIRLVKASLDEAFEYTADFTNIEEWDPGVAKSARSDAGELGVGSTFDLMVKFGPRESPMTYTITNFEPPNRVVLEGRGSTLVAIDDIRFAAVEGGTEIRYVADLHFKGFMRLVAPFIGSSLDKVGKKALDGLSGQLGVA
ncbi:MAG: hypothetical protein HKN91_01905 [Acidimicrobiia bacterium]|nr:hypothetical protein [Acidimicrobiia bacterium]